MSPEETREILIQIFLDIQNMSGRQVPGEITDGTCPIYDFEGFDSINIAEATSEFMRLTDYKLRLNLLLGPTPDRQLTIEEMVNRIQHMISAQGGLP